jgi:hypothetical protein
MTNDLPLHPAARPTLRLLGVLGALTIAARAHAQDCRLDYQRGAGGAQQIALGSGQTLDFATGSSLDTVRGGAPAGSGLISVANRGSAPLSLALVGPAIDGHPSTGGSTVVHAMGGLAGGVLAGGGSRTSSTGGTLAQVQRIASLGGSWLVLQPGERLDGLTHTLVAVACGGAHPITRAVGAGGME